MKRTQTILRRGVFNTRPRDFYDVHIMVKRQPIDKPLFASALQATSKRRESEGLLLSVETILATIRTDATMIERWRLYSRENNYARNIAFDEVIDSIHGLVK